MPLSQKGSSLVEHKQTAIFTIRLAQSHCELALSSRRATEARLSPFERRLASSANSFSSTVNRERPQSKQIKRSGNTQTPGRSRFSMPEKWMIISPVNCFWLLDPHNGHDISHPPVAQNFRELNDLTGSRTRLSHRQRETACEGARSFGLFHCVT